MQVQCVMYTVQCAGCSVMPAKYEDLEVENNSPSVFFKDGLRLYVF